MSKYNEISGKKFSHNGSDNVDVNGLLEKETISFFPVKGIWLSHCFKQPEDLDMLNLPCHLRDDLWLAKMFRKNQSLYFLSEDKILEFVKTSPVFLEKRCEYEQKIVEWQIDWMINNGENWIIDEDYGGDFVFLNPNCDIGFRKGIVDTLLAIGMNLDAIEEGIERNADMWRESLMNSAFTNTYEQAFLLDIDTSIFFKDIEKPKEERKTLIPTDQEFRKKWLQMRKYEYYQNHKDSVDKYGIVEPDMMLTENEVAELREYLECKHIERMEEIRRYEQEQKIIRVIKP